MQGETVKENYCPLDRMHLTRAWSRVRQIGRLYVESTPQDVGGGTNISQTKNVREHDGSEPHFSCFNQILEEPAPQDVEGGTNISQTKNVRGNNSSEALFAVFSKFVKNWNVFRFIFS